MLNKEFHVISESKIQLDDFVETAAVIHPYVTAIHIRSQELSAYTLYELINRLDVQHVPLHKIYVNDRVDVAHATNTGGVQLSYRSLPVAVVKKSFPALRVGKSVHSVSEAQAAEALGADYVLFGHIFPTMSKPGVSAQGLVNLSRVADSVSIPVIAIGGIKIENTAEVCTYADGIAILSGIWQAKDRLKMVNLYNEAIEE